MFYAIGRSELAINFESLDDPNKPLMSRVPGLVFGESGKLASYYWLFANKQNALEEVERDFDKILKVKENPKDFNLFNMLIYSTKYEPVERAKAFSDPSISKVSLSSTTQKIIADLCVKDRQYIFWAIIGDFKDLMKSHRKEMDVTIVLPSVPSVEYYELLLSKITSEYTSENAIMNISIEIDPSISRGYKISVGHKQIDNTWNTDLLKRNELEDQVVLTKEKKMQSLHPKVYDVKVPTTEENTAHIIKLIQSLSKDRSIPSTKTETSKTISDMKNIATSLNGQKDFFD
jgi:F0F1-type ATP synthase delta subunit